MVAGIVGNGDGRADPADPGADERTLETVSPA
jgi:hypothetical protein